MNFKRTSYIILILVLFAICGKASAICYNKCDNGTNCYYVVDCDQLGSVTCTQVNDSYCKKPSFFNFLCYARLFLTICARLISRCLGSFSPKL